MSEVKSFIERFGDWVSQPKNYRWLVPLLAFLVLLFLLKGCFSSSTEERRDYYVARDQTWAPLYFYGKEKNVLAFSDDLILQIAKRKKLKIHLVTGSSYDLISSLDGRNVDAIMSSLSPEVTLQNRYLFSDPYYNLGAVLIVDSNSPITSLAEMEGKDIGIKRGATILFSIPGHPNIRVRTYDSMIVMLDDVIRDRIDGALLNQLNAYNFTTAYYKGRLKVATPPLTNEGLRLISNRGPRDEHLINAFNEGLKEMKEDGSYTKTLEKWDLHDPNR